MRNLGFETIDKIRGKREAATVALGIFLVDMLARDSISMHAGATVTERVVDSLPSAFVAPEVSDDLLGHPDHSLDLAIDIGTIGTATMLARTSTETKGLVATALSAQVLASAANGAIVEGGLLDRSELAQQDVGASAISVAFAAKYLFDKLASSEDKWTRRGLMAATSIFAGAVTVGASYLDSKNAVTDFASHSAGVLVGAGASYLKSRRQIEYPGQNLDYDPAADAFVPAVEHG